MHRDETEDHNTSRPRAAVHYLLLELLVDRQIGGPLPHAPVGVPVLLRLLLAPESGLPEPLEILRERTNAETGVNMPRGEREREGSERPRRREVRNPCYLPLLRGGALRRLPVPGTSGESERLESTSVLSRLGPPRRLGREGDWN